MEVDPMARRMPKSFFWIDQKLIRSGLWMKLTATGKLFYVALSAACDRDGRCSWGKPKLAELAGGTESDLDCGMTELSSHRLIEVEDEHGFAVRLLSLEEESAASEATPVKAKSEAAPVTVHTHLTINLGNHAERRSPG